MTGWWHATYDRVARWICYSRASCPQLQQPPRLCVNRVGQKRCLCSHSTLVQLIPHSLASYADLSNSVSPYDLQLTHIGHDGSVAEWLACWTQAQKARVQIAVATLSDNSLRQTVHTHCASVHQAARLVAALLRVAEVTAGLAESNGSLPSGLWLTSPAGWLPRTGIGSGTLRSVIENGLPLPYYI